MRKPIIAGNWKMNKTPAEAEDADRGAEAHGRGSKRATWWCASPLWTSPAVKRAIEGMQHHGGRPEHAL